MKIWMIWRSYPIYYPIYKWIITNGISSGIPIGFLLRLSLGRWEVHMELSIHGATQNGWFMTGNPTKTHDLLN